MKYFRSIWLLLVIVPGVLFAQAKPETGFLPTLNISKKLPADWSVNFKAESRQALFSEVANYDYLQTDVSLAAAKKTGIRSSLALGYLMSIDDEGLSNRIFQQFTHITPISSIRFAQRLSADQTFSEGNYTEFRFRYRLSAEAPLSGQSLDPREFFLKFSNEYLNSFQGEEYDLEIRTSGFLGYVITPANKLELGIDYRVDSFVNDIAEKNIWIGLNFYQSL
jgi:hypothetical protein